MPTADHEAVAARFFAAIEAGDVAAIAAVYAPHAAIWHNTTRRAQSAAENVALLRHVVATVGPLRYEDVRRAATPTGFVQQHVLRCRVPGGPELTVPACIVCDVQDGRITRLDEYFDGAAVAPLLAALAAPPGESSS